MFYYKSLRSRSACLSISKYARDIVYGVGYKNTLPYTNHASEVLTELCQKRVEVLEQLVELINSNLPRVLYAYIVVESFPLNFGYIRHFYVFQKLVNVILGQKPLLPPIIYVK